MSLKPQTTASLPSSSTARPRMIDRPGEVVFQLDTQGRLTALNAVWTELTGFALEESLGEPGRRYVHPSDRASYDELCRPRAAEPSDGYEVRKRELRFLTGTGAVRWGEVLVRPIIEEGAWVGVYGTVHDITERHRAQEALSRRERYLSALVEIQRRLLGASSAEGLFHPLMAPLGEASGASRVYTFETHRSVDGELLFSQRAEWCGPGVKPELDNPALQDMPFESAFPRWYESMSRGQNISGLVKHFPPEEREVLDSQGILSLLAIPLWVHGALAGFIGFDNCAEEREWDRLEVELLQAATSAISLALEHRQAECALREREQRFRAMAENSSDVLYRYQLAGTRSFAFVSGVVTRNLGFTPEQHYRDGLLWHRHVHPEDVELLDQLLSEPRRMEGAPVVVRFLRPDGSMLWLQHAVTPVFNAEGRCVAVEGIARDITQHRQSEEALKHSEASFRLLLDRVPEPAIIQREGVVVFANPALLASLGYEQTQEVLGRRLREFLIEEPADSPVPDTALVAGERRLKRRDGQVRIADFVSLPLLFDGKPAVVSIARDVTEQRQLQSRLHLADRMASMGTLAAGIAHEINNPLAFVISNLGFLSDELRRMPSFVPGGVASRPEVSEWRGVLNEAREGAERVRQIVRQLKAFSRPDEERVDAVDLHAVLDSAVMLAANEIKHRARLKREYAPVPRVMGNEGRLCQVFLNLVVNAAQAIAEGAVDKNEILLLTRMGREGRVIIEVRDTGSGIPQDALGRIFDPFFTTKPVGVGTGLGLAICHGIITGLGGDIQVESEPGRGTTMRVVLPAAADGLLPAARPVIPPAVPVTQRGRILVVDDEPAVGRALKRILREHEVELATSGRQALELLGHDPNFHVILCDVMMPDLGGKDLFEAMVNAGKGLEQRFVFVSGGAFTPGARDFLTRVPNPTLEKPFDEPTVKRVVRELVLKHPLPGPPPPPSAG